MVQGFSGQKRCDVCKMDFEVACVCVCMLHVGNVDIYDKIRCVTVNDYTGEMCDQVESICRHRWDCVKIRDISPRFN